MVKQLLKKILSLFLVVLACACGINKAHGQMVYIPDANFRAAIASYAPSSIVGDSMNTADSTIVNMTSLDVSGDSIYDLTGITYFTNLTYLDCGDNHLTYLSGLPLDIDSLDCSANYLDSLSALIAPLIWLNCSSNPLGKLPALPSTLQSLVCEYDNLTSLPSYANLGSLDCSNNPLDSLLALTTTLQNLTCNSDNLTALPFLLNMNWLDCSNNPLDSLPALPSSLRFLYCKNNQLSILPTLPTGLKEFDCSYNPLHSLPSTLPNLELLICTSDSLDSLPVLPASLETLICDINSLMFLPPLPPILSGLVCSHDSLISLPILPQSLTELMCDNNFLTALPTLPNTLQQLVCDTNFISCLPFLPQSLDYLDGIDAGYACLPNIPASLTYLYGPNGVCNNLSPCNIYPVISGKAYNDDNYNQQQDSGELGHLNLIIQVQPGNYFFPITDTTGSYSYVVDTGAAYTISPITIPYYSILPASYSTPALYYGAVDSLNNFALQRIGIVHDLNVKATAGWNADRGFDTEHFLTTTNNGTVKETAASLQYVFDSSLTYISAFPAPDSINGNTLQWNNIYLIPGQKKNFSVILHASAFLLDGTLLTGYAMVGPVAQDTTPQDNYDTLTQTVVGSYDPNEITVAPSGAVLLQAVQQGQWLDYIIRFQNTGTDTAFNIAVQDTLSSNLILSSIQIISSSSAMTWSIKHGVANFAFNSINLPDSGSSRDGSHGFVRYRIKADTTLNTGNVIYNAANIYFDLNPPVATNTDTTIIEEPLTVKSLTNNSLQLTIYPDPAHNQLNIAGDEGAFIIYNLVGEQALNGTISQLKAVNISSLQSGVYFLLFENEKGRWMGRFVKE